MTQASDAARKYSREHGDKFKGELFEMLRIPSLSGDPAHAGDVKRMAEWLEKHMRDLGLQKVKVMPTAGHPVAYGEWLGAGPDKPTVLVNRAGVRPLRRGAGGKRRWLGHRPVRAGGEGWQDLRPRRDGRQGSTVHPRQGA